jgi:hypothetical protein
MSSEPVLMLMRSSHQKRTDFNLMPDVTPIINLDEEPKVPESVFEGPATGNHAARMAWSLNGLARTKPGLITAYGRHISARGRRGHNSIFASCTDEECAVFSTPVREFMSSSPDDQIMAFQRAANAAEEQRILHEEFKKLEDKAAREAKKKDRVIVLKVWYFDGSVRYINVTRSTGWKYDNKWLIVGSGVPRVMIPLMNIKELEVQKPGDDV